MRIENSPNEGVAPSNAVTADSLWRRGRLQLASSALVLASLCLPGSSAAVDFENALKQGQTQVSMRLRYESAQQDNALEDADALTLRTALGYTSDAWKGLKAFAEFEAVAALVDDYSGLPPPVQHSLIPDPDDAELNQWGIRYQGIEGLTATLGRSKLILDNARWVGNVGWRQNEQAYDGVFLKYEGLQDLALQYAYLSNVNSIFFTNIDLDANLFNVHWKASNWLSLTAYAYLLDFQRVTANTPDADSYGARASGAVPLREDVELSYTVEYAQQQADVAGNQFDTEYSLFQLAIKVRGIMLSLAQEVLGSDEGNYGLRTPLATLHAFNGWNDLFLFTPDNGLEDRFIKLSGTLGKFKLAALYHDFKADQTSADYGTEWGLVMSRPIVGALSGGAKFSQYDADQFGVDTDKLWAWLQYRF